MLRGQSLNKRQKPFANKAKPEDKGVHHLEAARVELERVRKTIASAVDYVDRGKPNAQERARAQAAIQEHKNHAQALETKYNA